MKISTKGRYALRMILYLAEHKDKGFIALKEIAQQQDISKKYLEQIVPVLTKGNILQTNRGFQGGYKLALRPDQCTVGMILRLTEGNLAPVACLEPNYIDCERSDSCAVLFVWQGLYDAINHYLDSVTLQDILDKEQERYSNNYII